MIKDRDGSLETLEESPSVKQDYGKFGRPPRAENATKRPVYLNENAPRSTLLLMNPKVQGVSYS